MREDDKVSAIVSGGASGMGEATARALRALGVRVAILDANEIRGREVADDIGASFYQADVTDESSTLQAFKAARLRNGQERILVHTPGGGGRDFTAWRDNDGEVYRHDYGKFSRIISLNLSATFLCASISAAGMMTLEPDEEGERGAIILTSSVASQDCPASTVAYVAGKSGINGMTLAMARDLGPEGIRVNTILPGNFETPLISNLDQSFKTQMRSWNLFPKRFGRSEEYASFAIELLRNRYINAALMRLDAGSRT